MSDLFTRLTALVDLYETDERAISDEVRMEEDTRTVDAPSSNDLMALGVRAACAFLDVDVSGPTAASVAIVAAAWTMGAVAGVEAARAVPA